VTTHVIGFDTNGDNLQRMADNGGGLYQTSNSSSTLVSALSDLAGASFDALASYPTAVVPTSRTAYGSSFYNAYFLSDENDAFWEGHIEAYDISPAGEVLDAARNPAVNVADEFVDPLNPHWDAGVLLRSNATRTLCTTISDAATTFVDTATIRAALGITAADAPLFPNNPSSGVTTQARAETAVINYVIGQDAFGEDNDASWSELRDEVLGDVFHSTPVVVGAPTSLLAGEPGYDNFYTAWEDRKRVRYVGANDGMFHGFDAGDLTTGDNPLTPAIETTSVFTSGPGEELFGYLPGLLLDDIKLIPRNNPRTYYFVDGSPVVADVWLRSAVGDYTRQTDEWSTVSITGFRERGAGYLALDITNSTATLSTHPHGPYPKYLWEFTDADLGETWSEPVITRLKVEEGSAGDVCGNNDGDGNRRERWVAIFGGGYETAADPNHADYAASSGDVGWTAASKVIFIVDIATGDACSIKSSTTRCRTRV
jgi:type IV pilus assembly protein PilY1